MERPARVIPLSGGLPRLAWALGVIGLLAALFAGLVYQALPWWLLRALPGLLAVPPSALSVGEIEISLGERRLRIQDLVLRADRDVPGVPALSLAQVDITIDGLPFGEHVRLQSVALANVKASLGDHRLLDIQLIDAGPVDLDLTQLSATVATLRLTRLHGDIELDAHGGTNLQTWVAGLPDTAAPEEPDWRIAIPDLRLADADLRLTDTHRRAPVGLDVRVRSLSGR
ncbi:MAG: hypothetical protein ACKOZX_14865, partial [Gammaproteobacteria bacterium]